MLIYWNIWDWFLLFLLFSRKDRVSVYQRKQEDEQSIVEQAHREDPDLQDEEIDWWTKFYASLRDMNSIRGLFGWACLLDLFICITFPQPAHLVYPSSKPWLFLTFSWFWYLVMFLSCGLHLPLIEFVMYENNCPLAFMRVRPL